MNHKKPISLLGALVSLLLVAACQPEPSTTASPDSRTLDSSRAPPAAVTSSPTGAEQKSSVTPATELSVNYGYTYQRPDGNRVAEGQGTMPSSVPIDIPVGGEPAWLVGVPKDTGSLWAVVLASGETKAFEVNGREWVETPIEPGSLNQSPPLLQVANGLQKLIAAPEPSSGLTHPAVLNGKGGLAYVNNDGKVAVLEPNGDEVGIVQVEALPDARLLSDERGRLLFLGEPTDRYNHGVLGDGLEAAAIVLVETNPDPQVELSIMIPEDRVIEGISPIWADITGDGQREIIVTLSGPDEGAQIVVYDEAGDLLATGPAIGQGYRWRHQLAVAPFGPAGKTELVDVLTPHIGGVVEFYQLAGNELRIVASMPGYTSHVIGTRNLDMAAAGDFDSDGRIELLLPNQARTELGAIRRTADGAEVAWIAALDGRIATNLATVTLADGGLAVGAGRDDGVLRIWSP